MAVCVGCGLEVNGSGVLVVDLADPGSGLACSDANGLSLNAQHINGSCVTMAGIGTSGSPLQANLDLGDAPNGLLCGGDGLRVDRSEDSCNGLEIRGNGLYAPSPDSIVTSASPGFVGGTIPFSVNALCGTPPCSFNLGTASATAFCNTTCCTVEGFWQWIAYGGVLNNATADFEATGFLTVSIDGGGFGGTPQTNKKYYGDADKTVFELGGFQQKDYIAVAPGVCHTINAQFTVLVSSGSATWAVGPQFESYVHLTQTGCI